MIRRVLQRASTIRSWCAKVEETDCFLFSGTVSGSAFSSLGPGYFQPWRQFSVFLRSVQSIGYSFPERTASSKQEKTVPSSSNSTSVTRKCFSRFTGLTAVHLLLGNFDGLILFTVSPQIEGSLVFRVPFIENTRNQQERFIHIVT